LVIAGFLNHDLRYSPNACFEKSLGHDHKGAAGGVICVPKHLDVTARFTAPTFAPSKNNALADSEMA
jgi:hypothetical protein